MTRKFRNVALAFILAFGLLSATAEAQNSLGARILNGISKLFNFNVKSQSKIRFMVWLNYSVGGGPVTYIENGQKKTILSTSGQHLNTLQNCVGLGNLVVLGEFGKFEGPKLKAVIQRASELVHKPYSFKALKVKGCPKTEAYQADAYFAVSALTLPEDSNNYALVCSNSVGDTPANCFAKIDKIDNAYK